MFNKWALNSNKHAKLTRKTTTVTTNAAGVAYLNIADTTAVWGIETFAYPCLHGYFNNKHFIIPCDSVNGNIVPLMNTSIEIAYWTS